jgi:hypothetical protein
MKIHWIAILLVAINACQLTASATEKQSEINPFPSRFVSTQNVLLADGLSFRRTVTRKDDKVRIESGLDKDAYVILDVSKRKVTTVLGKTKKFFSVDYTPYTNYDLMMDDTFLFFGDNQFISAGKEMLTGKEAEKFVLKPSGSEVFLLLDMKGNPLRLSSKDGATYIEWLSFNTQTEVDSNLFEVPKDYTPLALPNLNTNSIP